MVVKQQLRTLHLEFIYRNSSKKTSEYQWAPKLQILRSFSCLLRVEAVREMKKDEERTSVLPKDKVLTNPELVKGQVRGESDQAESGVSRFAA